MLSLDSYYYDQPWWLVICYLIIAKVIAVYIMWQILLSFAPSWYNTMISNNSVSIDDFVGQKPPSPQRALKSWLLNRLNVGTRIAKKSISQGYKLKTTDSDKVPGLKVTSRNDDSTGQEEEEESKKKDSDKKLPPVVVGTIRMGFGHHRIAYAATSWGLGNSDDDNDDNNNKKNKKNDPPNPNPIQQLLGGGNSNNKSNSNNSSSNNSKRETWFHDFLNIDSEEAQMIKDTDKLYSKGSRLASEMGGIVEKFWGSLTKSGDEDSLRVTYQFSEHMLPLINGLDKNSPIIATHSMVACAAVAAGFTNVINLVIDNHAQWFVVVPNALNLVQGPSNYHSFLKMGVPPKNLAIGGHWIPKELVTSIDKTCYNRITRRLSNKPLRIIIPVGGAGAQRKFIIDFVGSLKKLVDEGRVQLFLNAGDHEHMKIAFINVLKENNMDYDTIINMDGVQEFKNKLLKGNNEPSKNVTLFSYDDYFTAVATTDILCNVADVLACKPSELAFYPIPKLMIRRVGDHEAYSALRASELGDGTLEVREVPNALRYTELFLTTDLLEVMCNHIVNNNKIGIYDGCKNAMRIALERANATAQK